MSSKKPLSFAASNGKPTFDWRAFLSRTDQTDAEWNEAEARASAWVTCSIGQQCLILPRKGETSKGGGPGEPEDEVLSHIGGGSDWGFYGRIKMKDAREALNLLDLIELRVGYLLNKMRQDAQDELKAAKLKVQRLEAALS